MPLFRRDPRASESPADSTDGRALGTTRIVAGTRLEGALRGAAEIWIDGAVSGSIEISDTLTVGADGSVTGPIVARIVRVGGRVEGDIRAERIEILAGARVVGNLHAPRMIIAEGAHFEGRATMSSAPIDPPPPSPQHSPSPLATATETLPESPSTTTQPPKRSAARERRGAKASEGAGKL